LGYLFPRGVPTYLPAGPPRFLGCPFHARCPLLPRGVRRLLSPVASPPVAGFIVSGSLATPFRLTRPNRVRFRCGSRVRLPRPLHPDYSEPRSVGYMLNGQLHGKLLSAY